MIVQEVMTQGVKCVNPEATIQEAAKLMKDLDVGPLPVCDKGRLAGMVTDRDITIRATSEGRDPKSTSVRDIMTREVVYCFDNQDIKLAAESMEQHQIRRMLVLSPDKQLVGIVSLRDLALACGDHDLMGEVLEQVSETAGVV
jgi:CBS domain-containing protein